MMHKNYVVYIVLTSFGSLFALNLPNCSNVEFFEISSFNCRPCPFNISMISSKDGLSCTCDSHSVMTDSGRCRTCNVTEVLSADKSSCVPRRCQAAAGRVVCRKCPKDYITVTQNYDGSPMKEVQCVKCGRGYRAQGDSCVRCEACACRSHELVVRGRCIPKKYVIERPKYEEQLLHPTDLLDIVKYEYLCIIYNISACRWLANACVTNFYSSDAAGPCRLWVHPNLISPSMLPTLSTNKTNSAQKKADEIHLSNGQNKLLITATTYNNDGKFKHLSDPSKRLIPCLPPFAITIGEDYSIDCSINTLELPNLYDEMYTLNISSGATMKTLSMSIRKPNGHYVKKGLWQSNKFSKYFILRRSLSATSNITNIIYLRTMFILIRIERDKDKGSLKFYLNLEAQYVVKSPASDTFWTSLRVTHDLPSAGVLSGLQIWGTILGVLMACYALVQWRGVIRRGGITLSLLPILAGCFADALYFGTWTTLLHALAAEAGTLGLTLPLSQPEEQVSEAMIYTILSMKVIKMVYINWILCRSDIFFIDWSEYNSHLKEISTHEHSNGMKSAILAREWTETQTKRRTSPTVTIILTLFILQLLKPWELNIPNSEGYKWAVVTIAWWSSYTMVFLTQMAADWVFGSPPIKLQKTCAGLEISILVFQEELYAHYVHGRNDETSDTRYLSGPLTTCRVICAPQFSTICKQLLQTEHRTLENYESKQVLLSKFLAAFFERALDGLSWVASERTLFEKLFDLEILVREGGNTSILLYDTDNLTPSCFTITWWGNEWTLATFDSILFSTVLFTTKEPSYAAFTTIALWQIMKYTIAWLANRNVRNKTNIKSL